MPTLESYHGYYLWHYVPSIAAAIVFAVFFGLLTLAHGWKMFTMRLWFCLPFFVGGIFEIVGYGGRAAAYNATGVLVPYALQSIFILLAPLFFTASLSQVFGRLVRAVHGEPWDPMSPRWTTRIFVFGGCFSFFIQCTGAVILSNSSEDPRNHDVAQIITIVGLSFQLLMLALFGIYAVIFNLRFRRSGACYDAPREVPWQATLNMLHATTLAILLRNIFRVAEYVTREDGYLRSTEWPMYVFDGTLMLLTMTCFCVWYPNQLQHRERSSTMKLHLLESTDDDGRNMAVHGS